MTTRDPPLWRVHRSERLPALGEPAGSVTVAVVGICGANHIARCLDALAAQRKAPPFNIVLVYDPRLRGVDALRERYPRVSMIANEPDRGPPELAARAIHEADGDFILLTEDHCIPDPEWVAALCSEQSLDRAAVGGVMETDAHARAVDWAVYFVDFFRYMPPVAQGESPSLTHCNISYRRSYLDQIRTLWERQFHETEINNALRERFGKLWLVPAAQMRMRRNVRFVDAVHERYAFGRLFGCTRLDFISPRRRIVYALLAPGLPLLLFGRMARRALKRGSAARAFVRALPALSVMVVAWACGEWLGYLTARRASSLFVAPETGAAQAT